MKSKLSFPQRAAIQAMPFETGTGKRLPFAVHHESLLTLVRLKLATRRDVKGRPGGHLYEATPKGLSMVAGLPRPDEAAVLKVADQIGLVRLREIVLQLSADRFVNLEGFVRECAALMTPSDVADKDRMLSAVRRNAQTLLEP